jgi:hypothetical protein
MKTREQQTQFLANVIFEEWQRQRSSSLPICILGKAFKAETNMIVGSPSILLYNLLVEMFSREQAPPHITMFDPYIDLNSDPPLETPHIYFFGTRHKIFQTYVFPKQSVVIDPFRYYSCHNADGIRIRSIGIGSDRLR